MQDIPELLERFRRGPELVAQVITGVAGAEQDFHPEPGKWSIRQIVAHLADSEMVGAERFRRILAEEHPLIVGYNQDLWAERLDYAKRKPSQSLEQFRMVRALNYELLKDVPPEAFQRTGNHTDRGTVTLYDLLKIYAAHPEKHAQQIMNARQRYKQSRAQA